MTSTRSLIAASLIALVLPLSACSASTTRVCAGPETLAPDADWEDHFDTDLVVLPPDACSTRPLPGARFVDVAGPVPAVWEDLEDDSRGHYRHVSRSRVSSPSTPSPGSTRANTAPKATPSPSPAPKPTAVSGRQADEKVAKSTRRTTARATTRAKSS